MAKTQKFGLTTYGEPANTGTGKKQDNSDDEKFEWLRLPERKSRYRIITDPYKFYQVKFKASPDEPGYGKKIRCSAPVEDDPAVKAGCKAKERWLVGVIDCQDKKVKIFDYHVLVYNQLKKSYDTIEYGDPQGYDIEITFNPKDKVVANQIAVQALPPKALSEEFLKIKEAALPSLLRALERHSMPIKAETVLARMKELGWKGGSVAQENGAGQAALPETDNDDYSFGQPTAQA